MAKGGAVEGLAFLSYVREDSAEVDQLERRLRDAGISVWRDTAELWPGEDWRARIRNAITSNTFAFIACFSSRSVSRASSYQNEELTLAVDELRKRHPSQPWLIPVRFDDCEIPDRDLGGGRTFASLQRADLFGVNADVGADRLIASVRRILGSSGAAAGSVGASSVRPSSPQPEPTFGIIAALPEEFVAMRAMIDRPQRLNVAGDRADYVVGAMPSTEPGGPHPVVLTLLGETGNDAAASACANLVRSFPSVRCMLMVGIAAGIPSLGRPDRHVRLGDIVVASWGVVEYDSVSHQASGPVPRRTFPAASALLERRARMLDVAEISGERPWERWISAVAERLPDFARPPDSTDVLYAADDSDEQVSHPDPGLTGHRPGWPKVHRAMIASGDRSLRSARKRDEIAASAPDVLAIEMEGKGVGNAGFSAGVEWLIIRGISDYGDQHANRTWRNYAALTAAAYAKALLAQCPPLAAAPQRPGRGQDRSRALTAHPGTVLSVTFSPDGALLATGSEDRTARLWDTGTGALARTLTGHAAAVNDARFSPDGTLLLTVSDDRTADVWKTATGRLIRTLTGHDAPVWRGRFSPDGSLIATASDDRTVRLYHAATGTCVTSLTGYDGAILAVEFSPDSGQLATAGPDETTRLWRLATGQAVVLSGHAGRVWQVTFSPDGGFLATAGEDGTARIWGADGQARAVLTGHAGEVNAVAVSPDAALLATAGEDGTARIWDAQGSQLEVLAGHGAAVSSVAFSPDGTLIATASHDKAARLWETGSGSQIRELTGHGSAVWSVEFSADGSLLATADEDRCVRLWDLAQWELAPREPRNHVRGGS